MARVAVDGVAEQQQLDDRHDQDHRVGQPVARELDELLGQHRQDAVQRTSPYPRSAALIGSCPATSAISWMNTSSRVGATSLQRNGGSAVGGDGGLQRRAVRGR